MGSVNLDSFIDAAFRAWRRLVERRPVTLTLQEEEVRKLAFRDLPAGKVLQVLRLGSWVTVAQGERLIERGKPVASVSLIVRGKVRITHGGRVLGHLGAGEIVGSALLLGNAPAEVDGETVETTRTLQWKAARLERYLDANPETRNLFQRHLSRDPAGKVRTLAADVARI